MHEGTQGGSHCRHFGTCGGCTLQTLAPGAYRQRKRELAIQALSRHGIDDSALGDIAFVLPHSRRRAALKLLKAAGGVQIGFHALRSHDIADMHECLVLTPGLFDAVQGLRAFFAPLLRDGERIEVYVLEADNGFDLDIAWRKAMAPALVAHVAAKAPALGLVRVTAGRELLFQSAVPKIRLGPAAVRPPPRAFLQPTQEGEAALQAHVLRALGKARNVADLFSGCGTFALPVAEHAKVCAVDADSALLEALVAAARSTPGLKPVRTEKRDLFRRPLAAGELNRFDAVILDPPRAGALAQAKMLAKSDLMRIAYVSCDAASFARDAKVLTDGGFRLDWLVGVDQFLWSAHIELAAAFSRN